MKLIVVRDFLDKAFDNKLIRKEGDIIDTDDVRFNCSEELAEERIKGGFCVEMREAPLEKPEKKGKKASKKK